MELVFRLNDGSEFTFRPKKLFCLAYAGRTEEDREAHAQDVSDSREEFPLGFSPVPIILMTQEKYIEVLGGRTAGEVEFVLFVHDDEIYVTIGSDHADRRLEVLQSDLAKQVCAKPIATDVWKLKEVYEFWDDLEMRAETYQNGDWHCSQKSRIDVLLHPETIIQEIKKRNLPLENGSVYYCGTFALEEGKFWYGDKYRVALSLPNSSLLIKHEYDIVQIVDKLVYFYVE